MPKTSNAKIKTDIKAARAMSRKELFAKCREKLLAAKEAHLSTFKAYDSVMAAQVSGDDGDVAHAIEEQDIAVTRRENILSELKEIIEALERLDTDAYGVCEETEENIEPERLLAIPWTRLSLEGAVIRERDMKRQAG